MSPNYKWKVILIILVVASAIWLMYPPQEQINLGLDLQGGMHLVLKVDTSELPKDLKVDARDRALQVIRNRVDKFGVTEPLIQPSGKDRIIVELPGIRDRERAVNLIGRTALLEFKLVAPDELTTKTLNQINETKPILGIVTINEGYTEEGVKFNYYTLKGKDKTKLEEIISSAEVQKKLPAGYTLLISREQEAGEAEEIEATRQLYLVKDDAEITGEVLTNAMWDKDRFGDYQVLLNFEAEGRRTMRQLTREAEKKYQEGSQVSRLAIVLDDVIYSAPFMKEEVPSNPVIQGTFTREEANDLALVLRSGALPAPIQVEQERTIGPTLGQDSIRKGVKAALLGGIIVLLFMASYYIFAGLIADFALCINIVLILGALAYLRATLTLPGIAGIILTIGMAVDANVLIFERIREELKTGKHLRPAIQAGYHKVFSTIFDANITTLITAVILYNVGTGPVRGFAVTLSIGIIASMFTALVVTRVIFDFLTIKTRILKRLPMLSVIRETHFNIISKRKIAYILSAIVILAGSFIFYQRGIENFGIDFTGGTIQQVEFQQAPSLGDLRNTLEAAGLGEISIQRFGDENEILIRTEGQTAIKIEEALKEKYSSDEFKTVRVEEIGPTIGYELRRKAIWAIVLAMIAICIYITFRFEFRFAICAIIALVHDVLVTLGIFSIAGRELSLPIIAAILTIIGYSLNDTIVVFDRIREDLKLMGKTAFKDVVNSSINETLARTIITSLTTLLVVLSLYLFGGSVINDFALVLIIGVIVGTYSSVFVAAPILVDWHRKK